MLCVTSAAKILWLLKRFHERKIGMWEREHLPFHTGVRDGRCGMNGMLRRGIDIDMWILVGFEMELQSHAEDI